VYLCSIVRLLYHRLFVVIITDQTECLVEVDPYIKPKELLEISPKGLVPGLKLNSYDPPRAVNESTVIMDYLEECVFAPNSTRFSTYCLLLFNSLAATTTKRSLLPPPSNACMYPLMITFDDLWMF
jgi:hypothetical protein